MNSVIVNNTNSDLQVGLFCTATTMKLENISSYQLSFVGPKSSSDNISDATCDKTVTIMVWKGTATTGDPSGKATVNISNGQVLKKSGFYNIAFTGDSEPYTITISGDGGKNEMIMLVSLIIALFLILLAGGIGLYFYLRQQSKGPSSVVKAATESGSAVGIGSFSL